MELQHVNVKIFVEGELPVDPEQFIAVFHGWVQEQAAECVLIDVADYSHVPEGPGVMLIGLEADYSIDHTGGRWGLLYNRKAARDGSNADRIGDALRRAAGACLKLEGQFSTDGLTFTRSEFDLIINDRALAPNTSETWEAARPEIEAALSSVMGHTTFSLEQHADPRCRFGVSVQCGDGSGNDAERRGRRNVRCDALYAGVRRTYAGRDQRILPRCDRVVDSARSFGALQHRELDLDE